MKILLLVDRAIARLETSLVVLLLGLMIFLDFAQVILRNFFSSGFTWADTFLRQTVLWVAFLGASLAVQERKHINIDVFTRFMPERWKKLSRLLTDIFAAVVCFAFLRASITFVKNEIVQATTLFLDLPAWYFQVIIPFGYGLICFRFLIKALEDLQSLSRGSEALQIKK